MSENNSNTFFTKIATFIVDKRNVFFVLYIIAFIFCIFSMGWVEVENDITMYLPDSTETRLGIEAMNANFPSIGTAQVMVSNITMDTADDILDTISAIDGIEMVVFDHSSDHFTNACALYDITFTGGNFDESTYNALAEIKSSLAAYDLSVYTTAGQDMNAMLTNEMGAILVVASIIIFVVLTLTSRAYMEIPVLLLTFGAAALLNMGTNYLCGKISFISDSIAVVLQLALAIDYAIILCHRFTNEHETKNARDSAIIALSKAIPEISASSLTTISGLAALAFMEFRIGMDMSIVLIKSILLSLLSVFTLMPGLLVLFAPLIDKTKHPKLLPDVSFMGRFAVKVRRVLPPVFAIILVFACYFSGKCPYAYSFTDLKTAKMTEEQHAYFRIKDVFGTTNMVAVLVPSGDYEAEGALLNELSEYPQVKGTMGLATIEAMEGYMLADSLTPRQLSELIGMDYEILELLYSLYAVEHNQYGAIIGGLDEYKVPMFDMFLFLKDQLEAYNISLDGGDMMAGDMLAQLDTAKAQMRSDNYSRLVVYLNLPEEGEETYDFLAQMRSVIGKYYEDDYYIVGNSTSSRDLSASFIKDNLLISLLSVFFVIVVLLFTFQSVGLPILLILVIQGSIWINFSIPVFTGNPLFFLGYLIVNALMMGANIDYAIVISSHYQELKQHMHHKEAIVHAVNTAFPTVFTSGTIMASAGLLIGSMSTQPVICIMGTCIGRGTIISIFLVLFVLPSILVLGDSIIQRTSFKLKAFEPKSRAVTGTMRVHGRVRGHISGYVDAEINGIIHGQMNASVAIEPEITEGGAAENE